MIVENTKELEAFLRGRVQGLNDFIGVRLYPDGGEKLADHRAFAQREVYKELLTMVKAINNK
jgi:chromosome condensin MukBEF MukE localization factor